MAEYKFNYGFVTNLDTVPGCVTGLAIEDTQEYLGKIGLIGEQDSINNIIKSLEYQFDIGYGEQKIDGMLGDSLYIDGIKQEPTLSDKEYDYLLINSSNRKKLVYWKHGKCPIRIAWGIPIGIKEVPTKNASRVYVTACQACFKFTGPVYWTWYKDITRVTQEQVRELINKSIGE